MPSTIRVPGRKIEYDETHWQDALGGEYLELCRYISHPGENRAFEGFIDRIATMMLDLAWKYRVDFLDMTNCLYEQRAHFTDEVDSQRVPNRKKMTDGDHAVLALRILEHYGHEMTQFALQREGASPQPDLQDSHAKAQHVLGARERSSFPC